MNLEFSDLHLHSTLRPFAYYCDNKKAKEANIWYQKTPPDNPNGRASNYTQSDFTSLVQGNMKLAFTAMYPIEQGWFDLFAALGITSEEDLQTLSKFYNSKAEIDKKSIIKHLNLDEKSAEKGWLVDEIIAILGHFITALPVGRIKQIISDNYNYFEALKGELDFLKCQCAKNLGITPVIPQSNSELISLLSQSDKMIIIPTIEGASSLVSGNAETIKSGKTNFDQIIENINLIKNNYKVFFITPSHHFYNSVIGHSQSIYGVGRDFIDQMFGKGNVITSNGWKTIKCLLAIEEFKNAGYRILIDTKHLSIAARIEYYNFVENYNKQNPDDKIPIISSHSAFTGLKNIEEIGVECGDYSDFEVNIAAQEVVAISKSGGLLGLNFDKNVLSKKPKETKDEKKWTKEQWASLITDNLLGMVEMCKNNFGVDYKEIWDIFTIGTDFDGFISPMNAFPAAQFLPLLKSTLITVLNQNPKFKQLSFGLSAETVVNKFMGQNAIEFAKKHYNPTSSQIPIAK